MVEVNDFDKLADGLVEKHYQLRVEHNHSTMKWYAYYAGKGNRQLFESDLYNEGEHDWLTGADTPTEALQKLQTLTAPTPTNKGMEK